MVATEGDSECVSASLSEPLCTVVAALTAGCMQSLMFFDAVVPDLASFFFFVREGAPRQVAGAKQSHLDLFCRCEACFCCVKFCLLFSLVFADDE